jgi:type I restriction enzyme S subunit
MVTMKNIEKDKRQLPEGWRWAKLGDVIAEALPGFACGSRDPKGVIQLRMNNVDTRGNIVWDKYIRVPADDEMISRYQLTNGDVVFNNTTSTELVGKSAIFGGYEEPVVYSNHFTRVQVNAECLDSNFLASWLLLQWQERVFENLCNRWIGQSAVKNDKLQSIKIPLPPLSEQKRIAAILKEQIAAVESARQNIEAQLEAAKALPAALLRRAFNGEL